ncbi:hypothetical protein [Longimicrobium sp.]|uniref:hypothetical protein n=1 Tax=Longimicrobium sp. TaxID=2029185 RepID=UPI003B3A1CA6
MATELLQPVVEDGVRITNFFNGRLLTAEDLRREQDAVRDRHRGLAGAVGEGVVQGLEVSLDTRELPAPTVRITAGLGFNRDGDPVALPRDVQLRLLPAQPQVDPRAGLFALCDDRPAVIAQITNPGFYILAARPAQGLSRDQVPTVDLSQEGLGTRCGAKYAESGAAFSLIPLPLPAGSAEAPLARRLTELTGTIATLVEKWRGNDLSVGLELDKALSRLRNGVAYWIAGHDVAPARVASLATPAPSGPTLPDAPLEALRSAGALAGCDLPIALLFVTRRQLEWVDGWAVRRTPVPRVEPDPLSLAGDLPSADGIAAFMQFREHAASFLADKPALASAQVRASDWFLYLPPAGVLPLHGTAGTAGFDAGQFFPALRVNGPEDLAPARIPALLREALEHPPVDLSATTERIWLYTVTGPRPAGTAPSVLFTSYPLEPDLELSPVRITSITTWAKQTEEGTGIPIVHVGEPVVVTGKNFEASQNAHQVLVDGTPVPRLSIDATDTRLAFQLPALPDLPEAGRPALLVVSNRSTSAFRPLKVLPASAPTRGDVDVEFVQVTPAEPLPGEAATFRFTVRNRTAQQATVGLTLQTSEPSWSPRLLPAAAADTSKPITGVLLNPGEERSVFVRMEIPAAVVATKKFTLELIGSAGTVTGSSRELEFGVHLPSNTPDLHVTSIALVTANPPSALNANRDRVSVSPFYPAQVLANVAVDMAATYRVRVDFVTSAGAEVPLTGWSVKLQKTNETPAGEVSYTVTGQTTLTPRVVLSNNYADSTAQDGLVRIRVTRQGQSVPAGQEQVRDFTFSVQRIAYWWYYYF